jgi:hypothetical protein
MVLYLSEIESVQLRHVRRTGRTREREAEESLLLEGVATEQLLKTLLAWRFLVFATVICKVWRLAMAL